MKVMTFVAYGPLGKHNPEGDPADQVWKQVVQFLRQVDNIDLKEVAQSESMSPTGEVHFTLTIFYEQKPT